jgi:hypothetical protein
MGKGLLYHSGSKHGAFALVASDVGRRNSSTPPEHPEFLCPMSLDTEATAQCLRPKFFRKEHLIRTCGKEIRQGACLFGLGGEHGVHANVAW